MEMIRDEQNQNEFEARMSESIYSNFCGRRGASGVTLIVNSD